MYNVMMRTAYPNEFYHSGVKGQKWGQRRYQNPDGTLTAEGKARYKEAVRKRTKLQVEATLSANAYVNRHELLDKRTTKYNKLKEAGKLKDKHKTLLKNTKKTTEYWKQHSTEARKELETHVNDMTKDFKDRKIKDINYRYTKYGKQVSERILTKEDLGRALLTTAVANAILVPTVGVVAVFKPSPYNKQQNYIKKKEKEAGVGPYYKV